MPRPRLALLTTAAALALAAPALAQEPLTDPDPDAGQPDADAPLDQRLSEPLLGRRAGGQRERQPEGRLADDPDRFSLSLRADALATTRADAKGRGASHTLTRAGAGVEAYFAVTPRFSITASLDYTRTIYDFNDAASLLPGATAGDPFDDFNTLSLSVQPVLGLNRQWSLFTLAFASAGWEDGADLGDAFRFGGVVGASYSFSEDLTIGFGVGATTQLEDDPFVIPFIRVDWQISDRWRFETRGIEGLIFYEASDELELFARAAYERAEFRLDDTRGALPGGTIRDERLIVGAGADWRPARGVLIRLEAGAIPWQEFVFHDDGGDEVTDTESDPAAYVGASVRITF